MLLNLFKGRNARRQAAAQLYDAIVAQARAPSFFTRCQVPDTLDGRFEMIALHGFLVMNRLKREGDEGAALSQAVFDRMFADFDRTFREMGVGDLGVGRRVKAMARGFYGRIAAYEAAMAPDGAESLDQALARNAYGTASVPAEAVSALASYVRSAASHVRELPTDPLFAGMVTFGPPPPAAEDVA